MRNSLRKVKLENKDENDNNVRTTIQAGFTYQPLEQMKDFYTKKILMMELIELKQKFKI